ncbi:MAG: tetratricopeptide repeat protein [bacterium]
MIRLIRKGIKLKEWENWNEALVCFNEAIEIDNKFHLSFYNAGYVLYFGKKLYNQALAAFNTAIALNPNLAEAYYSKGHLLFHI